MATIVVTGGAGFIGSALVRMLIRDTQYSVVNVDKLTYAGNLGSLADIQDHPRYHFELADICDTPRMDAIFVEHRPAGVIHLAAESHVDRSIDGPAAFIQTNVVGTFSLLQTALTYYRRLAPKQAAAFRFVHVSTDEVFGSLDASGVFSEASAYAPNSPYSASKASADHLVRAWHHTYGLPAVITNCSNNYGPYQFPEKLIPLVIRRAVAGKSLPVYGKGENVRDWLFVDDHARALICALEAGASGRAYAIGGRSERRNIDVVQAVCGLLDELVPGRPRGYHESLVEFVPDRPGHDLRYAVNSSRIEHELGWRPQQTFDTGLRSTVEWYLANEHWCESVESGNYRGERLGQLVV